MPTTGTITGKVGWAGGPTTPRIQLKAEGGVTTDVPFDATGHYSVAVAPGVYTASVRPTLNTNCKGGPVTVAAGATVTLDLPCGPAY